MKARNSALMFILTVLFVFIFSIKAHCRGLTQKVSEDHFHMDMLPSDPQLDGIIVNISAFSTKPPYRYCTTLGLNYCNVWQESRVPVYVDVSADSLFKEVVRESINVWNMASGLTLYYAGEIDVKNRVHDCVIWNDGSMSGIFVTPYSPGEGSCLTGATGAAWTVGTGGYFDHAIVYIDTTISDYSFPTLFPTILHELGHAIGLDHPFDHGEDDTFSVMNYYDKHATHLTYNDLDVVHYLYGLPPIRGDFNVRTAWSVNWYDYESGRPSRFCIFGGTPDFSYTNAHGDNDYPFCFYVDNPDVNTTVTDRTSRRCSFRASQHNWDDDMTVVCNSAEANESTCASFNMPSWSVFYMGGIGEGDVLQLLETLPDGTRRFRLNVCFGQEVYVTMGLLVDGAWTITWLRPDCSYGFGVDRKTGLSCTFDVPSHLARSYFMFLFSDEDFTSSTFDWQFHPYGVVAVKLF